MYICLNLLIILLIDLSKYISFIKYIMKEIEAKFLEINVKEIRKRLKEIGAKRIHKPILLERYVFDLPYQNIKG